MGIVVDFVAFVLRRPQRRIPGARVSTPVATFDDDAFRAALAQLDRAQAPEVLSLGWRFAEASLRFGDDRRRAAGVAVQAHPDAAWVLCFDTDGHVREAALRRLSSPAETTGRFVALALRLNDWVPQVRQAAVAACRRVWPLTPPHVIAEAAPYLLRQRFTWKRWTHEARLIDEALGDAEVAAEITARLLAGQPGPLAQTLAHALRFAVYDAALPRLALEARRPDVRALAMKTLLGGKAVWPVGHGWTWVDKPMGLRRRIMLTESRAISTPEPPTLLAAGIADRSALVRKVAADAVIERLRDLPGIADIAARLANDRSPAIRDRADYIARHLPATEG